MQKDCSAALPHPCVRGLVDLRIWRLIPATILSLCILNTLASFQEIPRDPWSSVKVELERMLPRTRRSCAREEWSCDESIQLDTLVAAAFLREQLLNAYRGFNGVRRHTKRCHDAVASGLDDLSVKTPDNWKD